jgi:hypothetical protein
MKHPLIELVKFRVRELTNNGPVRGETLFSTLSVEFIMLNKSDTRAIVEEMIEEKNIIEFEFVLDEKAHSLFFPIRTDFYLRFADGKVDKYIYNGPNGERKES